MRQEFFPSNLLQFERIQLGYFRDSPSQNADVSLGLQLDPGASGYTAAEVEMFSRGYPEYGFLNPGHFSIRDNFQFQGIAISNGGVGSYENSFSFNIGVAKNFKISAESDLSYEKTFPFVSATQKIKGEIFLGTKRPYGYPDFLESLILGRRSAILGAAFWQSIFGTQTLPYWEIQSLPFLFGRVSPFRGMELELGLGLSVKRVEQLDYLYFISSLFNGQSLDRKVTSSTEYSPILFFAARVLLYQRIFIEIGAGNRDLGNLARASLFVSDMLTAHLFIKGKF
ncbi:MAG: hypothetical protein JNM63_17270 [Spirochaetia bacterium]|nr:hypothetical protein [Spirochaetia bacterium]